MITPSTFRTLPFQVIENKVNKEELNQDKYKDWIQKDDYPTIILNNTDLNSLTFNQLKSYCDKYEQAQQNKTQGILITYAGRADGYKCFFDYTI